MTNTFRKVMDQATLQWRLQFAKVRPMHQSVYSPRAAAVRWRRSLRLASPPILHAPCPELFLERAPDGSRALRVSQVVLLAELVWPASFGPTYAGDANVNARRRRGDSDGSDSDAAPAKKKAKKKPAARKRKPAARKKK